MGKLDPFTCDTAEFTLINSKDVPPPEKGGCISRGDKLNTQPRLRLVVRFNFISVA